MSRGTILVTGAALHERARQLIKTLGYKAVETPPYLEEDSLKTYVMDADPVAMLVRTGTISAAVIGAAKSLRVISKHGAGVNNIDIDAAASCGIPVVITIGANAQAVAEHSIALMLTIVKSLLPLDQAIRAGRWEKSDFSGNEIAGMTLGLVGFGAIAQRVSPLALALEMSVHAYDPLVPDSVFDSALVHRVENVSALLRQVNIVSFHCPLTADNQQLLNGEMIALMKRGSFVINTARGGLIDEDALVTALESGQIAGAGLDTFASEPPAKGHPYFGLPNVVLTPHIAGCTERSMERVGMDAVEGIHAVLSGGILPPARIVNAVALET